MKNTAFFFFFLNYFRERNIFNHFRSCLKVKMWWWLLWKHHFEHNNQNPNNSLELCSWFCLGKRSPLPQWNQESSACFGKAAAIAPIAPSGWRQSPKPADPNTACDKQTLHVISFSFYILLFFKILQWRGDECYNQEGAEEVIIE